MKKKKIIDYLSAYRVAKTSGKNTDKLATEHFQNLASLRKKAYMLEHFYVFRWTRPGLKGRKGTVCRLLKRGRMNSCSIEFLSDGYRAIVSRNAIRKMRICDLHGGAHDSIRP